MKAKLMLGLIVGLLPVEVAGQAIPGIDVVGIAA